MKLVPLTFSVDAYVRPIKMLLLILLPKVSDIVQILTFCVPLVRFSATIGEEAGSLTLSTKNPTEERLPSGAKLASPGIEVRPAMTHV